MRNPVTEDALREVKLQRHEALRDGKPWPPQSGPSFSFADWIVNAYWILLLVALAHVALSDFDPQLRDLLDNTLLVVIGGGTVVFGLAAALVWANSHWPALSCSFGLGLAFLSGGTTFYTAVHTNGELLQGLVGLGITIFFAKDALERFNRMRSTNVGVRAGRAA